MEGPKEEREEEEERRRKGSSRGTKGERKNALCYESGCPIGFRIDDYLYVYS